MNNDQDEEEDEDKMSTFNYFWATNNVAIGSKCTSCSRNRRDVLFSICNFVIKRKLLWI